MKLPLTFGALLCAIVALTATDAGAAQQTYTPAYGNLLLCFRVTGGTGDGTDLIFDLGSYSKPDTSLKIGPDLAAVYGTNWAKDTDLVWSIVGSEKSGTNPPADTLFVSAPNGSAPPDATSQTSQIPTRGDIGAMYAAFQTGTTGLLSNASKVVSSDGNSYTSEEANYSQNLDQNTEQTGDVGTGTDKVDIYELDPKPIKDIELGIGTLNADGYFTFQAEAIPEPSTWAVVAMGAAALLVFRKRRRLMTVGAKGDFCLSNSTP